MWKSSGNSSEAPVANGNAPNRIHMQIHPRIRKRKRKHPSAASSILSGSSSSSSEDEDDEANFTTTNAFSTSKSTSDHRSQSQDSQSPQSKRQTQQVEGWRVKLYRLNADGSWDDCGTGRIVCLYKTSASGTGDSPQEQLYQELGEPTLCMQAETQPPRVLLRTKILLRDAYQRQGDNIITWCEPYFEDSSSQHQEGQPQGVDLALSFQDNAGCLDIWRQITQVQSRAAEWFRSHGVLSKSSAPSATASAPEPTPSVTDMAQAVAAAHHASLQRQQQHAMWVNVASEAAQHHFQHSIEDDDDPTEFREQDAEAVAVSMAAAAAAAYGGGSTGTELPHPPTLQNLEEIADLIAAAQPLPQRESLAMFISKNDCSYLKDLLQLFDPAEARQDYGALATLAACVKTILLLNDPSVIDVIVNDETIYEQVCSTLEYDPDLRDKANHRWFLRERAKFRTVVLMEDEELINTIHRSFRVTYLRDTLLRPTMDESSLSTLASLQTFTHTDVVKGVTSPIKNAAVKGDSYLVRVMRLLGKEVRAISELEWEQLAKEASSPTRTDSPQPVVVAAGNKTWSQHLAPQDNSLASRKIRRRGCLSFFRELFNMVRMSLQQSDKDDFYAAIVCMEVFLDPQEEDETNTPKENVDDMPLRNPGQESETINLLSLLAAVLSDPTADVTERGSILEIIGAIAMHDPSHIRRHSLEFHEILKRNVGNSVGETTAQGRPSPNERRQVVFKCPPNDVIASLLFLLAVETDAGLLLQTTEIMRIILDTDMLGDHGPMGAGLSIEDSEGVPPGAPDNQHIGKSNGSTGASVATQESDQNQFLSLFYEHFIQWLVAPFQYTILHPSKRLPDSIPLASEGSPLLDKMVQVFKRGVTKEDSLLCVVPENAIRGSFAIELLSFCVRAHLYRMKFFLLRSRVLGSALKLLHPNASNSSGDRCLKLAALRLLRSILSVKDEFYHRHIIQHNLFAPVFEAFRANPVGDNLVSSAIVEMCDFIQNQNIKSLIEYIVTKHLVTVAGPDEKSLEDVATPYVSTLTTLRKVYEENLNCSNGTTKNTNGKPETQESKDASNGGNEHPRYFNSALVRNPQAGMSQKALEDQRKYRQADADESYFDSDEDDDATNCNMTAMPPSPTPAGTGSVDHLVDSERALSALPLSNATLLKNAEQS